MARPLDSSSHSRLLKISVIATLSCYATAAAHATSHHHGRSVLPRRRSMEQKKPVGVRMTSIPECMGTQCLEYARRARSRRAEEPMVMPMGPQQAEVPGPAEPWKFKVAWASDLEDQISNYTAIALRESRMGMSWMGADVASSIRLTEDKYVWIYGDTFVGVYDVEARKRKSIEYFPRQTLGLVHMGPDGFASGNDARVPISYQWATCDDVFSLHNQQLYKADIGCTRKTKAIDKTSDGTDAEKRKDGKEEQKEEGGPQGGMWAAGCSLQQVQTDAASSDNDDGDKSSGGGSGAVGMFAQRPLYVQNYFVNATMSMHDVVIEKAPSAVLCTNEPPNVQPTWLWILAGIRPLGDQGSLVLLAVDCVANGIPGMFDVTNTTFIAVQNPLDDPQEWIYRRASVPDSPAAPDGTFWAAAVAQDPADTMYTYILGSAPTDVPSIVSNMVLGRVRSSDLAALDLSRMEVWAQTLDARTEDDLSAVVSAVSLDNQDPPQATDITMIDKFHQHRRGMATDRQDVTPKTKPSSSRRRAKGGPQEPQAEIVFHQQQTLAPTWVPLSETWDRMHRAVPIMREGASEVGLMYHSSLKRWFMATFPFYGTSLVLWSSPSITGPWNKAYSYKLPSPWDDTARYMHYAAKFHPELATADDQLVVSFVLGLGTNGTWDDFYAPAASDAWYYMPRFVRIQVDAGSDQ